MKIFKYLCFLFVTVLTSCEENDSERITDKNVGYVNFYNAAEAVRYGGNLFLAVDNMIYINDSVPSPIFPKYPKFYASSSDDARQFPSHFTGTDAVSDGAGGMPLGVLYNKVYWLPLEEGPYNFIYTSKNKVYLEAKQSHVENKKYYSQYLVESPEADSLYTIIEGEVPRESREGFVRIQVVHLSPDLGPVDITRTDNTNTILPSSFPADYQFGQTEIFDISTAGTEDTFDKIFVKFQRPGDVSPIMSVAVPADSGAVYTVVLQGFTQETERKIKIGNSEYGTVTILPDLRINLRRMFF